MTEEETRLRVEKLRDEAARLLERAAALAREIVALADETPQPAAGGPARHRKPRRHLYIVPGIAALGVLAWRLLRRPAVGVSVAAAGLSTIAVVAVTVPHFTAVTPGRPVPAQSAPAHRRRAALPPLRRAAPAVPSAPARRAALQSSVLPAAPLPAPSGTTPSPSPSPSSSPAPLSSPLLSPSPSPATSPPVCVGLLGLRICL